MGFMITYDDKKQRLISELNASKGLAVGLGKDASNLFRDRQTRPERKLNVKDFNQVIQVNPAAGWVEVEGMTTYEQLVNETLQYGVMPAVVPELKSITIGGAVTGIGIESSSFKYGLVHETVQAMDIMLSDGRVVVCAPDNEYQDLFFGFPNSYGTLGYVLKLQAKTVPVKGYVRLTHQRYQNPERYFQALAEACSRQEADFIDGVVFGPDELYLCRGRFVDDAPLVSDYTCENIYYRSIRQRDTDYLTTRDYIWRWDTDWFWCSKNLYLQHPLLRRLVGKSRLNSVTYTNIMRWNSRWRLTRRIDHLLGYYPESVIQDVDLPIENAPAFLAFLLAEIRITPIWICPTQAYASSARFDLYPLDPARLYVNFGFWDVVKDRTPHPEGYYNRKIEHQVAALGGIKSLYSDAFYEPDEFWRIYNQPVYDRLKAKYDPQGVFKDLYQKTVLRQ